MSVYNASEMVNLLGCENFKMYADEEKMSVVPISNGDGGDGDGGDGDGGDGGKGGGDGGVVNPHYPDFNPTFCDFCRYDCVTKRNALTSQISTNKCGEMNWSEIDMNLGWQYCDCIPCQKSFVTNKSKFSIDTKELNLNLDDAQHWKIVRCVRPKITSEFIVHLSSVDMYTLQAISPQKKAILSQKLSEYQTAFVTRKSILLRDLGNHHDR